MATGSHREQRTARAGARSATAAFRRWWFANLTSNVGSWMQTVGAQWVMTIADPLGVPGRRDPGHEPAGAAAGGPGGVLGDLLDRKKLIIAGQAVMLASAAALGALDVAGS